MDNKETDAYHVRQSGSRRDDVGNVVVRRKTGTQRAVMKWYRQDVIAMANGGYAEVSHEMQGVERGCLVVLLPRMKEMVVTYRKAY